MDLSLLATLKDKVANAKQFSEVWEFFFDNFGESVEFIALGDRAHDPMLNTILAEVGRQLFGKSAKVRDLLLTRLPEQHFIHGGCTIDGKLSNVIYFEDIQMGLLAVVASFSSRETKMIRFSGRKFPMPKEPSRN